jgi:hypothetical protein
MPMSASTRRIDQWIDRLIQSAHFKWAWIIDRAPVNFPSSAHATASRGLSVAWSIEIR